MAGAPQRQWYACITPVILGFFLPVLILLRLHLDGGDQLLGARFIGYASNSFLLAGVAAVVVTGCALLTGYALRGGNTLAAPIVRLATLGYAIPGTVIAVGVLIPLGALDNWLDERMTNWFGVSSGLIFSGTMLASSMPISCAFSPLPMARSNLASSASRRTSMTLRARLAEAAGRW
jgi:iron(III) transport system permease protein